VAFSIV